MVIKFADILIITRLLCVKKINQQRRHVRARRFSKRTDLSFPEKFYGEKKKQEIKVARMQVRVLKKKKKKFKSKKRMASGGKIGVKIQA